MKIGNCMSAVQLSLISILMLLLFSFLACSKGEEPSKKTSGPANNPYSSESVFEEVQRKLQKNPNDADTLREKGFVSRTLRLIKRIEDTVNRIQRSVTSPNGKDNVP